MRERHLTKWERLEYLFVLVIALSCVLYFAHTETQTIVVKKIDMQQEVYSNDGSVSTSYYCRVYSDKGLYDISQSGIFAHPEIIGRIHDGDTVTVTSRGYNLPVFKMYRTIVSVK